MKTMKIEAYIANYQVIVLYDFDYWYILTLLFRSCALMNKSICMKNNDIELKPVDALRFIYRGISRLPWMTDRVSMKPLL